MVFRTVGGRVGVTINSCAREGQPKGRKRHLSHDRKRERTKIEATQSETKRVCVVGGGAAGLVTAWTLVKDTRKSFDVEIWEASDRVGGAACSIDMGNGVWLNEKVQMGFTKTYPNTLMLLKELGFEPTSVHAHQNAAYGVGNSLWNNFSKAGGECILAKHNASIKSFIQAMKFIDARAPILGLLPISVVTHAMNLPRSFNTDIVYPLLSTINGTGSSMSSTPTIVVAACLASQNFKILDIEDWKATQQEDTSLFTFPKLEDVYGTLASRLDRSHGCSSADCINPASQEEDVDAVDGWKVTSQSICRIRRRTPVLSIRRVSGRGSFSGNENYCWEVLDKNGCVNLFDHVVFACSAEVALRILSNSFSPSVSLLHKVCLGVAKFYNVPVVTHSDGRFIGEKYGTQEARPFWHVRWAPKRQDIGKDGSEKIAETEYNEQIESDGTHDWIRNSMRALAGQFSWLNGTTMPRWSLEGLQNQDSAEEKRQHVSELTYCFSSYQPQLASCGETIWQTTLTEGDGIQQQKVLSRRVDRHMALTWLQFTAFLLFMPFIQGWRGLWFCGAYLFCNNHEAAIVSGLAVGHRLGAEYPFADTDGNGYSIFKMFMRHIHGRPLD